MPMSGNFQLSLFPRYDVGCLRSFEGKRMRKEATERRKAWGDPCQSRWS